MRKYSYDEVQSIIDKAVNEALDEQAKQFEVERERQEILKTLDELKERIEKLEESKNIGFGK